MIARVLIDIGSSLNVMPKATLDKLYLPNAVLKNSPNVVRAFYSSKREVIGKITLHTHRANHVMNIRPTYNCLLGGPWIHAVETIPSSLHQKVKFIAEGQLISVMGQKELIIRTSLPDEYVEVDEEALETSFQALEIVGTTSSEVEKGHHKMSRVAIMAAKVLISNGFVPDKGLGRKLDGMVEPVAIQENPGRSRLGYEGATRKGRSGRRT
ncbi:hypothetical protein CR513_42243, partial [Mucuna pruriens]